MRLANLAVLDTMLMAAQGRAETIVAINEPAAAATSGGRSQRIAVSVHLTSPAPAITATSDWTKAIATASQSLDDVIAYECEVLRTTLKGDCHLIHSNTGGNVGSRTSAGLPFAGANTAINVNANATFEIVPRAPAQAAPVQQ
jgi:hypothetical protein